MMKINISCQVNKYIKKLPKKQAKQIAKKIIAMHIEPHQNDTKKIVGSDYYRVDIGEYRLIYRVENNMLYLVVLGKRNDSEAYKLLNRIKKN